MPTMRFTFAVRVARYDILAAFDVEFTDENDLIILRDDTGRVGLLEDVTSAFATTLISSEFQKRVPPGMMSQRCAGSSDGFSSLRKTCQVAGDPTTLSYSPPRSTRSSASRLYAEYKKMYGRRSYQALHQLVETVISSLDDAENTSVYRNMVCF
jgi:hypothetical protein